MLSRQNKIRLLISIGQILFLSLLAIGLDDPSQDKGSELLVAVWAMLIILTWAEEPRVGAVASILSFTSLLVAQSLLPAVQFGAILGVFLGCMSWSRRAIGSTLTLVAVLALARVGQIWPIGVMLLFAIATFGLRSQLSHVEAYTGAFATKVRQHFGAIIVYMLAFVVLISTLALIHRSIDVHREKPELEFSEWKVGEGAPTLDYYVYFVVVTSLAGPPNDVQIKGTVARYLVSIEIIFGVLFLASILQQMIALTPVLYARATST